MRRITTNSTRWKSSLSGSEDSFGIHVAKIAGMPGRIVKRAEQILHDLEANNARNGTVEKMERLPSLGGTDGMQLSFFQLDDPVLQQIRDELLNLDVDNLTPIEALNKLNDIKRILKGG